MVSVQTRQKGVKAVQSKPQGVSENYYPDALVECACGAQFRVGSTVQSMKVEVCSACHPFFTGSQKLVDTAGQVDKFRARLAKSETIRQKLYQSKSQTKQPVQAVKSKESKGGKKISKSAAKEAK